MIANELNSPREMVARAAYVLYVFCLLAGAYMSVVGLIVLAWGTSLVAMGMFVAAAMLRQLGRQRLGFATIERELGDLSSFASNRELARRVAELQALFERLETMPMSCQERQRLRRQIIDSLHDDEQLVGHFWPRLRQRHPYLIHGL